MSRKIGICPDCGKEAEITSQGICLKCRTRKFNATANKKEYVRYLDLTKEEQRIIDKRQRAMANSTGKTATKVKTVVKAKEETKETVKKEVPNSVLMDKDKFMTALYDCGCEIEKEPLEKVLDTLIATEQLKNIIETIATAYNADIMSNLDQFLNVMERKLQHNWEYSGFMTEDEIKFKDFLRWRRMLKGSIYYWKKLYQTNTLNEMTKVWANYVADPADKPVMAMDENRIMNPKKRYQITTITRSTIYNTSKQFTRIFFASNEEEAYEKFTKFLSERQLHEDKSKTTIVELTSEGEDGRK